jgi:hypothetical protein
LHQQQVSVTANGEAFASSPYTISPSETRSFTGLGELIIDDDIKMTWFKPGGKVGVDSAQ